MMTTATHRMVRKTPDFGQASDVPLTDELIAKIAKFNGALSPAEVRDYLLRGHTIGTHLNSYRLVEASA